MSELNIHKFPFILQRPTLTIEAVKFDGPVNFYRAWISDDFGDSQKFKYQITISPSFDFSLLMNSQSPHSLIRKKLSTFRGKYPNSFSIFHQTPKNQQTFHHNSSSQKDWQVRLLEIIWKKIRCNILENWKNYDNWIFACL